MTSGSKTGWRVLEHGPIEKLEDNLWRVEGTLPNMALRRTMTIARRATGQLVLHNAVALAEPAMREIDSFGAVEFLVVPNGWHRLDARQFVDRYPAVKVLAPRAAVKRVSAVVPVAGTLADFPSDPDISITELEGTGGNEGVMSVRSHGKTTLVFADAVFNMPHLTGFRGFILRHVTQSSGGPRVSRVARLFLVKDKAAFAGHLDRLATADLARIIVAHHAVIGERPAEALRHVAASVRPG